MARKCLGVCLAALLLHFITNSVQAQLPQDVRDVFEGMLDDLESDIQAKFKDAIANETSTVEFTPDQFKRFRANPVNPFEGLEEIDADHSDANIALKFELPSMRNRSISPFERQTSAVLLGAAQPAAAVARQTVRVFSKKRQVALGLVVKSDGYILTKASEIEHREKISCELSDGLRLDAKILKIDNLNDLAILKIEASGLSQVQWSKQPVLPGAFVISPDFDGSVIAIGTYSVAPRSTAAGEQAFLGVKPETTTNGVRVSEIEPGNASHEAGLTDGDVITKLGGKRITDVSSLVKTIRDRRPGDSVEIEYLRNGTPAKTKATLAARDISGEQAARFKMMNRLGAVPSRRFDNFPTVFQHDTPLFPEHCGGPIVDLDGNLLGINIARNGRAATYAIPSSHVMTLLEDLLRENVASR
jgi:serine protease Do